MMPERLILRVISMIDEMMTLLESVQVGEDIKKAYFDERDDEAKALTRQITGHKDLLVQQSLLHSGHAEIDP